MVNLTIPEVNEKYNLINDAESPIKVVKSPKFTFMQLNNASGESPRKTAQKQ